MGVASYLIYSNGTPSTIKLPLTLYGIQLFLNFIWTPLFFGAKKFGAAFADILLMDSAIIACIGTFYSVSPTASYLMIPYLMWTSFASYLNFRIWRDNPNFDQLLLEEEKKLN